MCNVVQLYTSCCDDLYLIPASILFLSFSLFSYTCRSQAKAAVAYNYNKRGGGGDSDDSDAELGTYHGEEGEDKAFSSESEYGETLSD